LTETTLCLLRGSSGAAPALPFHAENRIDHSQTRQKARRRLYEGNVKWHGGGIAKEQLDEALLSVEKNRKTW
jgi:hypothetical protein